MLRLKLLCLNIRKHPLGSLMIVLLIAFSVALSMTVNLQERAFREGSTKAAERFDLVIGGLGSETQLVLSTVYLQPAMLPLIPTQHLTELEKNPQVQWAAPLAFGDFYQGMPLVGTNKAFIAHNYTLQQGRNFEQHYEAVVGKKTGLNIGDVFSPVHGQIGESGAHAHEAVEYRVVGVLPEEQSIWDSAILVPIESIWDIHAHHDHEDTHAHEDAHEHADLGVSAIIVKPKTFSAAYNLRAQYRNEHTQALFPAEVLVKIYSILGDSKTVLTWIASITQILVATALMMVIVLYFRQQQRQIAAWRIFGAPRHKILLFAWLSLLLLVVIAMVLGTMLGYMVAQVIANALSAKSGFAMPVYLQGEDAYHLFLLFIIAMCIALIPSFILYRQSPTQILNKD
ncbi:ABC transporter permease [Conservatibacter flavescens]|uniref:ABC transporter permease n=1 Tax=Conservatibacter flavescens TaxID=28161 RepID=A0A2M8S4A8_9PAST|nr:ABC transporter permease [Conservatibacter flavescens]PJG85972.1 ABC transporter permease [Conservatibacter flavescens]